MPLISVIIPAYNSEKTIAETVESVLKQTFADFELIVINDGSTDGTLEVLSRIQDPRLKVFSHPNAGSNPSRNRGFAQSSGEYIAFLDADDLWTPDKLEAQLNALQENPQAAVAHSWCNLIDESSKFLSRGGYCTANGDVYPHLLLVDILENGSNPLIRREALNKVGAFDESLPAGQDWDLYLRLAAQYHFITVERPQISYRISSHSLSSNVVKLESGCLQVITKAFNQAPDVLQYLKPYTLGNLYNYLIYKALSGYPDRKKALNALRFTVMFARNQPSFMQKKLFWKIGLRMAIVGLLPPQKAVALLDKIGKFGNINNLLEYIINDPSQIVS
ncbi:MAG: glycosyltransferase [Roseofilum sp. SBFL]|uniref:glycosyltransferase n=1 Tax=unclassified Roseofilum TaxID=2620099 RepID=UPI001B2B4D50|nr:MULTISPECIES: glycosyltransferase [unclassified Roseofilum]MBP0012702.1 glycosyltransferase [Roseofilum sp. SID3]MBP0026331.1 glycosyltransferase [Roseofilum sp. SID2]MBP0040012.1 glycosyltransferase [Roseofilum sp. SID1]MBP0042357.1 glycosyltransferase [Roseofilum sp. SBFL]